MKKKISILVLVMLCCMSACTNGGGNYGVETADKDDSTSKFIDESDSGDYINREGEKTKVDEINKTIIAQVLGVEENHRKIRFILSSLHTIQAGQIQNAEIAEVNDIGEKAINILAEDGTNYQIVVSNSLSVIHVKNLDTGEYPVQSAK